LPGSLFARMITCMPGSSGLTETVA
jgi:hypothetical protein